MRVLAIFISLLLVTYTNAMEKYPKLSFLDNRVVDIKEVKQGAIVKRTFRIENTGKAPLVILSINKSCNCTNATISNNILYPDESGNIEVEIDTKDKIGKTTISIVIVANTLEKEHALRISMVVVASKSLKDRFQNFWLFLKRFWIS